MQKDIQQYHDKLAPEDKEICEHLYTIITEIYKSNSEIEAKVWHAHPVWFFKGNPIVGYSKLKDSVRLLFWSGQSFDEPNLQKEGSFKAAEARYTDVSEVNIVDLKRWLKKAIEMQWDYKNIVKRRGVLVKLEI